MLRRVTWRFWTGVAAAAGLWFLAGAFWRSNGPLSTHLFAAGFAAAFATPVIFTIVYTLTGNKWWQNDVGVNQVMTESALLPMCGIFAWVALFQNGSLHSSWEAWAEIGSPFWAAAMLSWRNWIIVRLRRETDKPPASG